MSSKESKATGARSKSMSFRVLPGLVGINAGREITAREETLADKLVEIGEGAIEKYQREVKTDYRDTHREIYNALVSGLTFPEYNADTLQQLVFAYANQKKDTEEAAIVRGLYTGMLASELTRRNQEEGKRTRISLNGGRGDFPYLLYFAHTLDEVVVEGFNGDYILGYAGSNGGRVKNAVLKDIKGKRAGAGIARYGRAGIVTMADITGNSAGADIAGDGGRADIVTMAGIEGNWAGASIAENGRANIVTMAGIEGNWAGAWIAWKGRADIVTMAGIKGDGAGAYIASYGGLVKRLFAGDNEGKEHFEGYYGEIIPLQEHKNAKKIKEFLRQLKEKQEPERLAVISQQLAEAIKRRRV